jgi:hypothetical protein
MRFSARFQIVTLLAVMTLGLADGRASAQNSANGQKAAVNTSTRISWHGGPVMFGTSAVYVIWYGCWDDSCGAAGNTATRDILEGVLQNVGGTPYFQINAFYPTSVGAPSGALLHAGSVVDRSYAYGTELTASNIQGIVGDQIRNNGLPEDPSGIYVVMASADVGSVATGFCVAGARPHHGMVEALGSFHPYAFVGNPARCPKAAAPEFIASNGTPLPTSNGNFSADTMANTLVHLLDGVVTNPSGGGWFDRYGLENADKCQGMFGPTYLAANGARANLRLGSRDFLIQQNWVNDGKGRCAMQQFQ